MGTAATPEPITTQEVQPTAEPDTQPTAETKVEPKAQAEPKAQTHAQSKKAGNQGGTPAVDKYAEARLAKKKQRRKAHRLTIKRSNTNG